MLKEQVPFCIRGRGSARYCLISTSKLIVSVDPFLQNSKRLKYEVALHEPSRSWIQGAKSSWSFLVWSHSIHPSILGISTAGPSMGEVS